MCLWGWSMCKMCKCVPKKAPLAAHQCWLAPCGVSLISWITGVCSSYRVWEAASLLPPPPLFFKDHRSVSPSSPSLHLSLGFLLRCCHAGSPSLTSCQGTYRSVHPEIFRRDLNKGWFIPRWLHFHLSFSDFLWDVGSCDAYLRLSFSFSCWVLYSPNRDNSFTRK